MRYLILILVLLLLVTPVSAKGPSDRIVITGPTLDEEIIVTDLEIVVRLSMASLENYDAGPIAEPENPGDVYYDLERQYEIPGGRFQIFDRVRYYPNVQVVLYLGIENGSSGYDRKWFRATTRGIAAMEALFLADPYVVLMDSSGMIEFADAVTLEPMAQVEIVGDNVPAPEFITTLDMHTLYFRSDAFHHRLTLDSGRYCVTSQLPLTLEDGLLSFDMAQEMALTKSQETGTELRSIRLLTDHRALLYQPDAPGIQVRTLDDGAVLDEWQPDLTFAEVVAGGDYLYALENGVDTATLHVLDARNGTMIHSRTLDVLDWHVGYGWLDLSTVETGTIANQC